jgi:hypothetical protein
MIKEYVTKVPHQKVMDTHQKFLEVHYPQPTPDLSVPLETAKSKKLTKKSKSKK